MLITNIVEFCSSLFLFSGLDSEQTHKLLSEISPEFCEYSRGDTVFSRNSCAKKIGFVYSGCCEVCRKTNGKNVSLNIISKGSSFGITSLFSENYDFPTEIRAVCKSTVMFITKSDIDKIVKKSYVVALNIMRFLTDRICFLNERIATFSSQNVEKKLANHLLVEFHRTGESELFFNCKKSAEAISVGRASLYRAIDTLVGEGVIKFESKKIIIIDPIGLERISK